MTFIKVKNESLRKYFNFPNGDGGREIRLELNNHREYNAVITLSSNDKICNSDYDTLEKIEAGIKAGVFYNIRIKTYINRRTPGSLKYDDFEFSQCMPDESVIDVLIILLDRIVKLTQSLNGNVMIETSK